MSTTPVPFTLIEGSMALPGLRPLDLLPARFGCEWALLPPGHSLRLELKALYAALLRTVCLTPEAIRAFCAWEPMRERRHTLSEARPVFAETAHAVSHGEQAAYTGARGASLHWSAVAGGVCALGGAAMLAWLALGHVEPGRDSSAGGHRGDAASLGRQAQRGNAIPADIVTKPRVASVGLADKDAHTNTVAASLADAPGSATSAGATAEAKDASRSAVARASHDLAVTPAATSKPATPVDIASNRDSNSSSHTAKSTARNRRLDASNALVRPPARIAARNVAVPRFAGLTAAKRIAPRPSAAGSYSPLAPNRLGIDEYASTRTYASAHPVNVAPAPRSTASTTTSSATSGTEWMNHMSQRRVTEIPDQFAQ
ncbi:MAG TPA: hypothetical protein VFE79_02290 [Paraburkholderia sp.]|jgi:hypothetical protein|nr:hypothetical protein [Paraburkholderia sp.]